jgi:hypothetical protein
MAVVAACEAGPRTITATQVEGDREWTASIVDSTGLVRAVTFPRVGIGAGDVPRPGRLLVANVPGEPETVQFGWTGGPCPSTVELSVTGSPEHLRVELDYGLRPTAPGCQNDIAVSRSLALLFAVPIDAARIDGFDVSP